MTSNIPLLVAKAESIPEAFYKSMRTVYDDGANIRTQYDRQDKQNNFIDPPSKDASVAVEIADPFAQPRFPVVSYVELGAYIAETCWGVKNHLVPSKDELLRQIEKGKIDTKWPYTYPQRLFGYPSSSGPINQIELLLDRVVKSPYTRRATAITLVPELDHFLGEDLPCLQRVWLRGIEGENGEIYLHMNTHWRSRDLFKAWNDNVIAMTFWQRMWVDALRERTGKDWKIGPYKDFSDSLHIYGQDINEKGVKEFLRNFDEEKIKQRSMTSEQARDMLIIPQLEDLIMDEHWKFPEETKELMRREIEMMRAGKYLP